jgi:hypothetical protein
MPNPRKRIQCFSTGWPWKSFACPKKSLERSDTSSRTFLRRINASLGLRCEKKRTANSTQSKSDRSMSKSTSTPIRQQSAINLPQGSLRGQDEDRTTGRHDPYQRPPDTLYAALAMSTECPSPLRSMPRRPVRYSPVNRANMLAHLTSVLDEAIELFDDD